jgi:hypothetical protein
MIQLQNVLHQFITGLVNQLATVSAKLNKLVYAEPLPEMPLVTVLHIQPVQVLKNTMFHLAHASVPQSKLADAVSLGIHLPALVMTLLQLCVLQLSISTPKLANANASILQLVDAI